MLTIQLSYEYIFTASKLITNLIGVFISYMPQINGKHCFIRHMQTKMASPLLQREIVWILAHCENLAFVQKNKNMTTKVGNPSF